MTRYAVVFFRANPANPSDPQFLACPAAVPGHRPAPHCWLFIDRGTAIEWAVANAEHMGGTPVLFAEDDEPLLFDALRVRRLATEAKR